MRGTLKRAVFDLHGYGLCKLIGLSRALKRPVPLRQAALFWHRLAFETSCAKVVELPTPFNFSTVLCTSAGAIPLAYSHMSSPWLLNSRIKKSLSVCASSPIVVIPRERKSGRAGSSYHIKILDRKRPEFFRDFLFPERVDAVWFFKITCHLSEQLIRVRSRC